VSDQEPQDAAPEDQPSRVTNTIIVVGAIAAVLLVVGWLGLGAMSPGPQIAAPAAALAEKPPAVIGTSVQGRPIEAYSFGTGPRRYLVIGGIHGDEYGAAMAESLVGILKADSTLVPSDARIDVVPTLNPDGRAASMRGNAQSVDINRNLPSMNWSSKLPVNDSAAKEGLNGGASPASEPETKALVDYLRNGYAAVVTLHSAGGIVDYDGPGGKALADRVSRAIGLKVDHLDYQPSVHGSMGLYVPETYGIPVITIELESSQMTSATLDGILVGAGAK
jgi:protein MpaA